MSVRAESTEFRPSSASSAKKKAADDAQFKKDLLELIPFLRAFARSLCGNQETADDLAQETLVKAWQARDMFAPGTNLKDLRHLLPVFRLRMRARGGHFCGLLIARSTHSGYRWA